MSVGRTTALAVVAALVVVSCGGDDDDTESTAASGVDDSAAATAAPGSTGSSAATGSSDAPSGSSAASGAGAADGEVATIGAILSETGIYSTLGPPERKAITMGLEALNETGFDVDGTTYTMEVVFADDKSDAATSGVTAFREMVENDEVPVIGFGLGSSLYAPLLERTPLPMINILDSTYPSILEYNENLFLTRGDSTTYVPGCVNYATTQLGVGSMAIITATGEPYAEGLTQLVQQSAETEGVEVTATVEYPLGATDYGNAITEAVAGDPDAIYLSSVTAVILPVLKQLRESGYDGPVFHSSGVNPNQAEAILGSEFNTLMEDNYDCAGTLPTTSSNEATKAFADAYQERWDEYPQDLTMWAYDFPFIVAAAMSQAGSTTDREAITAAFKEITVPEGTVSGWIPGADDVLFTERGARTPSEITVWCPEQQTIASAMVFDVSDGSVVDATFVDEPCAGV